VLIKKLSITDAYAFPKTNLDISMRFTPDSPELNFITQQRVSPVNRYVSGQCNEKEGRTFSLALKITQFKIMTTKTTGSFPLKRNRKKLYRLNVSFFPPLKPSSIK
jgi:hypothetical protein